MEVRLPNDPSIQEFHGLTDALKIKIIKFGLFFYNESILKSQTWDNEQWQLTVETMALKHNSQITLLTEELEMEKQMFDKYRVSIEEKQKSCIECAVNTERAISETQVRHLTQLNNDLLSKMNKLQEDIESRYASRMMESNKIHQELLIKERDRQEEMRLEYENKLARQQNSYVKGKEGEEFVIHRLTLLFPTSEIEDTHAIPHRGDFVLRQDGFVMMIETKNYSKNVQKSEIDKFYNDIDNPINRDIQCGIFVSLNTGICGKDDFQFEIRNRLPIIFIHHLNSNFESITMAVKFFKLILDQKNIDLTHKETVDAFKNMASTIKRNFQKQKTILDRYYNTQMELFALQQNNIEELFTIVKQKF